MNDEAEALAKAGAMTDSEFLHWVADRLVFQHRESPNVDFVQRLRGIAQVLADEELGRKVVLDGTERRR